MVAFTLLALGQGRDACKATMLDFDGDVRVLADPGWNGDSVDDVLFLERHLGDVDFIILSHSTPEFIGAYILLCVKFPMLMRQIPVYATVAVSQLARVSTVEFYRARGVLGPVETAFLEISDVDEWLDKVTSVKFQQNMAIVKNKIVLTAYNAGHTLGGAFWLITKRMEKVVYAPTWNHSKDSFLNSASFLVPLTGNPEPLLVRPTTLITRSDLGSQMSHKKRTEKFLQLVNATLANGGAVLLPVAISGRFFELLRLIDDYLLQLPGSAIPVYLLSYSGTKVLSYAANLVDWMSSHLIKQYTDLAVDSWTYSPVPLEPSTVNLLSDPRELLQLPGPKIVFASGLDFASGDLSLQALQYLCQDEKLTLILTEKSPYGYNDTLSAGLYGEWHRLAAEKNGGSVEDGIAVPLEKAVPMQSWVVEEDLAGAQLAAFKERVASARRQKLLAKVRDKKNKNILNEDDDDDESSSSEENESPDEEAQKAEKAEKAEAETQNKDVHGKSTKAASEDALLSSVDPTDVLKTHEMFVGDYIAENLAANKPIDIRITVRMKPKQATFPYPFPRKKRKFDDYGEVIDAKQFQLADDSNNANTRLISESKRKFELNDRDERKRNSGNQERKNERKKLVDAKGNRLTPLELLSNEVLRKNLDALYRPVRRIVLGDTNLPQAQLKLRCGLSYVDLSGLVDLRSLVMIVSVLRPQSVVLLPDSSFSPEYDETLNGCLLLKSAFAKQKDEHKSKIARDSLLLAATRFNALTSARRGSMAKGASINEMKVYEAQNNETAQIGGDGAGKSREFEVKLDENLDNELKWQKLANNYRVTQVRGELSIYESQISVNKQHSDSLAISSQFILKPVFASGLQVGPSVIKDPAATADNSTKFGPAFGSGLAIGNVRLPELKKKLIALDMDAEFKGEGMLVVNDEVAIKKMSMGAYQGEDTGDLIIEGQIGPLYYNVKNCIKEMLAFV